MTKSPPFDAFGTTSLEFELEKYDHDVHHDIRALPQKSWSEIQKVSLLGTGSFSEVHLVITAQSRQKLALKCLDLERIEHRQAFFIAASDLATEAEILSQLDHENIIRLRGISSTSLSQSYAAGGGGYFLLLDVLQDTLKDRLQRWRADTTLYESKGVYRLFNNSQKNRLLVSKMYSRIETVAKGVANGLKYLHDRQIVLRDLKPANVGFDEEGKVRLFDFGMARNLLKQDPSDSDICGTPRYMAPEIMTGNGGDHCLKRADIYSFGVLLFELCTLQTPFAHCTSFEQCQEEVSTFGFRPSVKSLNSISTQELIEACWNQEPILRPPFEQICKQLEHVDVNDMKEASSRMKGEKTKGRRGLRKTFSNISLRKNNGTRTTTTTTTSMFSSLPANFPIDDLALDASVLSCKYI
jgi:serine/threonine protein kinase